MEDLNLEEVNQKIFEFKENLEQKLLAEYKEKQENTSENNQQEEIKLTEIFSVHYYDQLSLKTKIKDLLITVRDVYIVELVSGDSTTYEIYLKDINHKIAEVDIEGKITFSDEKLENHTTLNEIQENNSDKNDIKYDKESLEELDQLMEEELKENLEEEKEPKENQINEEEQEKSKTNLLEDAEKNTEQLEKELKLDKGDIRSCTKIKLTGKDNVFRRQVPECKEFDEVRLVYISSQDTFKFVGLKKGQPPKFLESIEPSKETMKTSMDVDAEDGKVEVQNIHGLMKFTNSKDYDFSVKIGQYGYIELNMLRKDPITNKYISTKVETTTQRPKERQEEINKLMDKDKNLRINEEIDRFEKEKQERGNDTKVNLNDISDESEEKREELEQKIDNEKSSNEISEEEAKKNREEITMERTLDENVKKYYY